MANRNAGGRVSPFAHLDGLSAADDGDDKDKDARKRGRGAKSAEDDGEDDEDDKDASAAAEGDDEDDKDASAAAEGDDEDDKDASAAEGDDEDEKKDDDKAKKSKSRAKSASEARREERARCSAIFSSKAARGRVALAAHYAFNTNMTASEAVDALRLSPRAGADAPAPRRSLADDMASFASSISAADAPSVPKTKQVAASWGAAFERAGVKPR